ncbi:MAG: carbon storage regulator [Planctomycetota bacterium]
MLVLSRRRSEAIRVAHRQSVWLLRLLEVDPAASRCTVCVEADAQDESSVVRICKIERTNVLEVDASVQLTLVDVRDDKARFGIHAPRDFDVHRLEVYEAIRRERGDDDDFEVKGTCIPRPDVPPTLNASARPDRRTNA